MIKRGKNAQISIFIIISIIIVVALILYFFIKDASTTKRDVNPEIEPIFNFVQDCLKKTAEDGIYEIGQTGGYFSLPENSYFDIAYYFYEGKNTMPSKEFIEEQLSDYVNFALHYCTGYFIIFEEFNISEEEVSSNVIIEDKNVIFQISYPLTINKDDITYQLKDFEVEVPIRLGIIYNAVVESIDEQVKKTDAVCTSCLYDIGDKYELNFHVLDSNVTGLLMFFVRDEKYKLKDEDYVFYYMVKLSGGENGKEYFEI